MRPHGDRIHSDPPSPPPSSSSSATPTSPLGSVRCEPSSTYAHATASSSSSPAAAAALADAASSSSDDGYEFIPAGSGGRDDPAESDERRHRWRWSGLALERSLADRERRWWSRVARRAAAVLAMGLLVMCALHAWSVWPLFFPLALGALALQTYYHFCRWDKAEAAEVVVSDSSQRREV